MTDGIRLTEMSIFKMYRKREPSCTVGGNLSWYNHCGNQYGYTLEIYTQNYHMTLQSHSWASIQTKLYLKETHAPACSLQHYSQ